MKLLVENFIMPYTSLAFGNLCGNDIISHKSPSSHLTLKNYKMRGEVRINVTLRRVLANIVTVEKP